MACVFLAEFALGWISVAGPLAPSGASLIDGLMDGFLLFFSVGIYEELVSRGYVLRTLAEGMSLRPFGPRGGLLLAFVLSSLVFGLLHQGNPNATPLLTTLNLALAGMFLGLGYVLTGELAISIGIHMTWNMFQGLVFGFPVSGLPPRVSLISIQQSGPEAWTGGAFGPEGGLVGILALVAGSLLILAWVRRTRGLAALEIRLAIYDEPGGRVGASSSPRV